MGKKTEKVLGLVLAGSMVVSMIAPGADAASKMSLSKKKITIQQGAKAKLKVKKATKKVKWSVTKGKKVVKLTQKKKTSVTIVGKSAGSAVVTAKSGKKKLNCKVTVKAAPSTKEDVATQAPATQAPATQAPVTQAPATQVPATQAPATQAPVTQAPATQTPATQTPAASASATPLVSEEPTVAPSQDPSDNTVRDISIDMTKVTNSFDKSPIKVDVSQQIPERVDLSLFSKLEVTYTTAFDSEESKANFTNGKIAIAKNESQLDGYSDGIKVQYELTAEGGTVSVDLSGVKGYFYGINFQPFNESYGWPDGLTNITITAMKLVAKEGAVYPDPTASAEPTEPPIPTFAPETFSYEGLDTSWIDPSKPMVAFTFDDGPCGMKDGSTSMAIQEALTEAGAHATFFYIGERIDDAGKAEIQSALDRGFEIGNHSYGWSSLSGYEPEEILDSVGKTNAILTEISGYSNFLFRAPNLSISEDMLAYIKAPFINCAVDSKDWNKATTEQIIENVEMAKDGDVVLMHATEKNTVAALPTILKYFNDNGYQVVSVSELFAMKGKTLTTGQKYSSAK